ncbi:MAG: LacI family DNA-binding transcriptional regulator [Planctomycetota bacterium]
MGKRRANIRDVARESGVSLTTVSLVINGNDQRISEPTRQRVRAAIEKLHYTPSRLARGLPNRRANTLAVLVPALQHAFADAYFGEIISGIYESAADRGYRILLEVARRDYIRRKEYLTIVEENAVDAILFVGATAEHEWLEDFAESDRPLILVNNRLEKLDLHHVVCDYSGAGQLAASYLIELGHHRIGHVSGPRDVVLTSAELTAAFVETLKEHGVATSSSMIVDGQLQAETGKLAADELLERDPKLTAIFAANDKMALGVYQSLRERGLKPGVDVSVLGCDDIATAPLADPPLTTIRMNFFDVGAVAARQMIDIVEKKLEFASGQRISEVVDVSLVPRESCRPVEG